MKKLSIFTPTIAKAKNLALKIKSQGETLDFEIKEYPATEVSQLEFLLAIHNDDAVIVDCTIPNNLEQPTVYPILTAQINMLDHVLVFSDNYYDEKDIDGYYIPILPLNITPQRKYRSKDKDATKWLVEQLMDIQTHDYYPRLNLTDLDSMLKYKPEMEKMLIASMSLHESEKRRKTLVMISYRSCCYHEVEQFLKEAETQGNVEILVLPPTSLCGDNEAHTPMRRWMLVGMLDDCLRDVGEVWVYYNDIYTDSWWTLAELVMVAYINFNRDENNKLRIKVYDAKEKRFLLEKDYPQFVKVAINADQHRRLSRLLSNTRPDTMGPENIEFINQLKLYVPIMRNMSKSQLEMQVKLMIPLLEQGIPQSIPKEQQEEMLQDLVHMYSDPDELERYVNDEVFQDAFWNNISYQTEAKPLAMVDGVLNIDVFMDTPMSEDTKMRKEDLDKAIQNNNPIVLNSSNGEKRFRVKKGIRRYLWLATRMGQPTIKDAAGLEVIQTYNLITDE